MAGPTSRYLQASLSNTRRGLVPRRGIGTGRGGSTALWRRVSIEMD